MECRQVVKRFRTCSFCFRFPVLFALCASRDVVIIYAFLAGRVGNKHAISLQAVLFSKFRGNISQLMLFYRGSTQAAFNKIISL